ncbi:hypothetical protein Ocin01_12784 [Orchesella cincta]|uniref:E3 ubiquitin-protein ligase RNF144B n=1 Tax=Orchesella cincta TaxID=48709 RepID=A0A1D2MLM1_ORCCI|nr:hypothetical protein Ocin01_12784 [Orchesella cincta]
MPTNLKNLLSRSRSKNELKLRESKDEISPSGSNGESSSESEHQSCEPSGHQVCVKDTCCCRESSESSLKFDSSSYLKNESENKVVPVPGPNSNLSSNTTTITTCNCDESPEPYNIVAENFHKSLANEPAPSPAMLPPGNGFRTGGLTSHNIHNGRGMAYQCCSQNYDGSYHHDMPPNGTVADGHLGGGEYCGGYFLDEKSSLGCSSRLAGVMDQRGCGEMRRNASCKTLFLSCTTLHQPSSSSYERPSMDPSSEFSPCESRTSSAAAVPSSLKMPTFSQARTSNMGCDDCESLACGSPSSAARCTFKDGSPSQSLSIRKCETVLALSNFHGNVSSTTSQAPSSNPYGRSSATGTCSNNYPGSGTQGAAALSHLSSSSTASNANVGGKVKVMKEKIFSTSSSALNCLLHSSSRTGKLFSGWKLSSANNTSSNSGSNSNIGHISSMYSGSSDGNCLGVNCQPNKHFLGSSTISSSAGGATDNHRLGSTATGSVIGHHHKSRSQLSIAENGFSGPAPLTPVNRLRRNVSVNNTSSFCAASGSLSAHSSYSRSSSVASFGWKEKEDPFDQSLLCRLCLCSVRLEDTMEIHACSCRYCKDCLISYVTFEIQQGADEIACPDAGCDKQGVLGLMEVEQLVPPMLTEKHKKFRLFREVEKDSKLMWCPSPGCETVCQIQDANSLLTGGFVIENDKTRGGTAGGSRNLPLINCPTCRKTHCAECKLSWHPDSSCESFRRKLIKQGKLSSEDDELFSLDSIKKCPFCHVPIEKDSGCAQMMCKRCKHVFCWYCLASLDDDFLLRHYDKGPCKNKLGHSRASVVWHRAQVIGIFAGFGVLVLLASPLLILAAPCLLCCRCRYCANKLDPDESPVPV